MSQQQSPWKRCRTGALAAVTGLGLALSPTVAFAAPGDSAATWEAQVSSISTGVKSGYQLVTAGDSVYVADAQWRVDGKVVGTPESTPLESGSSMRTTFSPYGIAVDPDVNGEAVVVTTTARQTAAAASNGEYNFGGGVVVYSASQGAPTDADRVFEYQDGSPVFSGPRRVAVDSERNLAYVTNLGDSRGSSSRDGYITVLDLTKRGTAAVIAQVTVPDGAGSVGVDVDEVNNLIYVGGYADRGTAGEADVETLYVIDGSEIKTSDPKDFSLNNGAIRALDAVVGGNARPTFNAQTQKVYVSAYDLSTITVVDADPTSAGYGTADKVIDVTTGSSANNTGTNAVEVDAERGLLYSANLDAGVSVYDIENDYQKIEFTDAEGGSYSDIPTSGRAVNFGLNEATGEVWVSTGTVDVLNVAEQSAPVFTTQPADQTVVAGESAEFEVVVSGSPAPALQWQTRANAGAEWANVANATSASYELPTTRATDGTQLRVIASNEHGEQTSAAATLTVHYAPVVTASPLNATAQEGETASFAAAAEAKPAATVVWQQQPAGSTDWQTIAGATAATLEVADVTREQRGTLYRAVFVNEIGEVATESAALAVNATKPAPLEEDEWREFVPGSTEELLEQPAGDLTSVQTGTTVTISNIPVADGDWVEVFGFSAPQYLGSSLVANNGQTTIDVASFAVGTHHLAIYDTNNVLLGYVTFVINPDGTGSVVDTPAGTTVLVNTGGEAMMPFVVGAGAVLLLGAALVTAAAYRKRGGTRA